MKGKKVYYDFLILKDDTNPYSSITSGLNVALTKLTDCLTKEDADEWVEIIHNWFPTAIRCYPEKEEQIRTIEPQVKDIVERIIGGKSYHPRQ